ncbi:hypothetical protein QCD85_06255 [Paenibacillus sp. PsM32]|uniref:hypothetical protein n=1 Tax=unclassified Paenibacillus TaxID=185978 RepID=UPI0023659ED3|nr:MULTISPECIES: hypothetical protein [unclassified Paenibacillus]MDN4617693.1 hypothetical protein [Paenibacillus sp. PsM32]WDF52853.1 hypothetical protein PQ460_10705 [Paenibacillus sp. KACC 21273]
MYEFIGPSIEKQIESITQENDKKFQKEYSEFDALLTSIKSHLPAHLRDATEKLETMYIQRVDCIAPVYRRGFEDAIKLFHFFQNVRADEYNINKS